MKMSSTQAILGSSFYAIMSPSVLKEQKLKIPENFVNKNKNELSRMALMADPNGHVWRIGLNKIGNDVWFQDNWKEFVEHYSIKDWYFLLFKFRGMSAFHVLIFDMSASEIRYRVSNSSECQTVCEEDVVTDHDNNFKIQKSCDNLNQDAIHLDEESDDSVRILESSIPPFSNQDNSHKCSSSSRLVRSRVYMTRSKLAHNAKS